MSTHVVIDHVSKRYSAARDSGGVFDINTVIPAGKFTTLLGESGSGKTTLLRLLAGFLRPDSGTIAIGESPVASKDRFVPTQARDLAMVFQSYALWPHMTVFDNVAFGLRARKAGKDEIQSRVRETLSLVGLAEFEARKPAQLSGGQQQRVALARSLVLEPNLLLLDEPLSNLDADLRVQMRNQLKALQRRTGISFVYVTHDQEEAFALSDHMIVLDHGRILQQGDSREIYHRPESAKVAEFMGRQGLQLFGAVAPDGTTFTETSANRAPLGMFEHLAPGVREGGPARLIVHSEDLVLTSPGDRLDHLVSIPGTIESVSFAGRENHVVVDVDGAVRATAYAPLSAGWAAGDRVQVAFAADVAWLVPDADGDHAAVSGEPAHVGAP